jgi:hypothetical protein
MIDIEVWEEGRTVPGGWRQDVTTAGGMMKAAFIHNNNNEKGRSAVRDQYAERFCSSDLVAE